jgi:hypothetical protein
MPQKTVPIPENFLQKRPVLMRSALNVDLIGAFVCVVPTLFSFWRRLPSDTADRPSRWARMFIQVVNVRASSGSFD